MSEFLERVGRAIGDGRLIAPGQAVLVAVSGGVDSMTLLNVLATWGPKRRWKLTVAHLNHGLRGRSSDADERLVRDAAKSLGLPFVHASADVKRLAREEGVSIEMAARRCRHEFFARAAKARGIRRIALAHHADDQAELFFLRLLRGAGVQGLAGMKCMAPAPWEASVKLVRPLLQSTRAEIDAYAQEAGIRFREDASNASSEILRNRVRHELLPLLRERFQPGLTRVVLRQMEILSAENEVMQAEAKAWFGGSGASIRFDALPVALQRRVLQIQLERLPVAPEFELIETLRKHPGRIVSVAPELSAVCDGAGKIVVRRLTAEQTRSGERAVSLESGSGDGGFDGLRWKWRRFRCRGVRLSFAPGFEWFDAERVGSRVILRHWRAGDRFQPIGMTQSQKLQDLFTNMKVPRAERRHRVVATTDGGVIWWVEGLRIGEMFKLRPGTRIRLKWTWSRPERISSVQELPGWTDKMS